jgi:hypothetical protein
MMLFVVQWRERNALTQRQRATGTSASEPRREAVA